MIRVTAVALMVLALLLGAAPVGAQWEIQGPDGSSIKFGLLLQGRAEWVSTEDVGDADTPVMQNLYLRRARLLFGGQIHPKVSFFAETDSPNLGKAGGSTKSYPDMYLQDFIVTWKPHADHFVDMGLLLTPGAYNHLQSAISLLALDYGPFSFIEAGPLATSVGRDTGVQARGLLAERKIEYRAGLFQGVRDAGAADPFRFAARAAFFPFGAGPSYFYTGSFLGTKEAATIGVAVDAQHDYLAIHGDAFYERPLRDGQTVTLQADISQYDGGDWVPAIPEQMTWMFEGGFAFLENRVAPFVQIAGRTFDEENAIDETQIQGGIAWRLDGHRANIKAGVTQVSREGDAADRTVFTIQAQAATF